MSTYIENRLVTRPAFNFPSLVQDPHEQLNDTYYQEMKGHFFESLLIYDRILVPTHDFTIVKLLYAWLGEDALRGLIEDQTITLLRLEPWIGYGGGIGLSGFRIEGPAIETDALLAIGFASLEIAIPRYVGRYLNQPASSGVCRDIQAGTKTVNLSTHINDIIRPMTIKAFGDLDPDNLSKYGPDALPGTGRDQVSIYSPLVRHSGLPTEQFLALAQVAVELSLLHQMKATHSITDPRIDQYLGQQLKVPPDKKAQPHLEAHFNNLMRSCELPDIPSSANAGWLSASKVLELRNHTAIKEFRLWLEGLDPDYADSATRAYIRALEKEPFSSKLPFRVATFIIPKLFGLLDPTKVLGSTVFNFLLSLFAERMEKKNLIPKLAIDTFRRKIGAPDGR